jgi:hypothetical protein
MLSEPIRLRDYTYQQWREIADRFRKDWSEDDLDVSWMRHIEFPVWEPRPS